MTTTDDLLDMTVSEQKEELENLSTEELQELRGEESRRTALDHIDTELTSRERHEQESSDDNSVTVSDELDSKHDVEDGDVTIDPDDRRNSEVIEELERKVDYLIEKCKTTSHEGFENYEN